MTRCYQCTNHRCRRDKPCRGGPSACEADTAHAGTPLCWHCANEDDIARRAEMSGGRQVRDEQQPWTVRDWFRNLFRVAW
jgi:hypothetical protein